MDEPGEREGEHQQVQGEPSEDAHRQGNEQRRTACGRCRAVGTVCGWAQLHESFEAGIARR
jgi:hypothetical protein